MRPLQDELSKLKDAERGARARELEAVTASARAQDRAAEESRTDASVAISANLAWIQLRGAGPLEVPGADVGIRQSGGAVLLLGPWKSTRGDTVSGASIDASAPRTRVQTIAVEISGNPATAESLRGKVGIAGLRRLIGK